MIIIAFKVRNHSKGLPSGLVDEPYSQSGLYSLIRIYYKGCPVEGDVVIPQHCYDFIVFHKN